MKNKKLFLILALSLLVVFIPSVALADIPPSGMQLPIVEFLVKLLLTVLIEALAIFFIFKTIYRKQRFKNMKLFVAGTLPSLITFPVFYFIHYLFFSIIYPQPTLYDFYANGFKPIPYTDYSPIFIVISEILIFIFEGLILSCILGISKKQGLLVSFVVNLLSFLLGTFIAGLLN
jgi:hypothetical protein